MPQIFHFFRYEQGLEDYDEAMARMRHGRGMMDDHYEHNYDHDHDHPVMKVEMKEMKEEKKAVATDPWASYYDFIINEGSFKFWSIFQVGKQNFIRITMKPLFINAYIILFFWR